MFFFFTNIVKGGLHVILKAVAKTVTAVKSLSNEVPILPQLTFASQEQTKRINFVPPAQTINQHQGYPKPTDFSRICNEHKKSLGMRLVSNSLTIDENVTISHPIPQKDEIVPTSKSHFESLLAGKFTKVDNDLTTIENQSFNPSTLCMTLAAMKTAQTNAGGTYSNRYNGTNYFVDFVAPTGYAWQTVSNGNMYKNISIVATGSTYANWYDPFYPDGMRLQIIVRYSKYTITDSEYSFSGTTDFEMYVKSKNIKWSTVVDRSNWITVTNPLIIRDWNLYWYEYIVRGIYKARDYFVFITGSKK